MFKKIALIAIMAFSLSSSTVFAAEVNTPAINTDTTEELSASQIVDELYQNERSETVKQLAHDLLLTITGEKEPANVYSNGLVEIGTYPRDYHGAANIAVSLIGDGRLMSTHTDTTFTVFLSEKNKLTKDSFEQHKSELKNVYEKVQEVKRNTVNMDQKSKIRYIAQYVANSFVYDKVYYADRQSLASALNAGASDCEWYASYFYILASNCGVNVSCRTGINNKGNYHAWNAVNIDGQEMVVDVSSGDYHNMLDYFLLMPMSNYPCTEKWDIWSAV